jgi:serine/threonine protein kinase
MLGEYQLCERLGAGGMAEVYRATDRDGRPVAVKVLYPHLTADPGFVARFKREAEAGSALDHPHVIRRLAHGAEGELSYLVMERVEGPSLRALLADRQKPLTPQEAVGLVAAVADALDHAHRRGVVHRDVKPSNILLRGGRLDDPVLTDFGVARMIEATVSTASGTVLGTPTYMAPEQGQGEPGDARSDIYALGVVLYELLVGQPPFTADSPYALILRHIHTPPLAPRSARADLPRALEAAVLRSLAKAPDERYATAAEFAAALRASLVPADHPPNRVVTYAFAGVALLAVLLIAGWRLGWLARVTQEIATSTDEVSAAKPALSVLTLQGGPTIADTWLDPDVPDRPAFDDGKIHLQGPSTPDRVLLRLALPQWPAQAELITATLSLYTVPWKAEENRFATVAVHRILTDWDPNTATYETPWSAPGLAPGVNYEAEPLANVVLADLLQHEGWLDLDITTAVRDWLAGKPNYGLAVRLTDDSFGMAHWWIYAAEYEDASLQPKLTLTYRSR